MVQYFCILMERTFLCISLKIPFLSWPESVISCLKQCVHNQFCRPIFNSFHVTSLFPYHLKTENKWGVWKETIAMKWIKSESKLANCRKEQLVNPCHATVFFLSPQKSFGNFSFSDVFRGYRKRPVAWNGLMSERVSQSVAKSFKRS